MDKESQVSALWTTKTFLQVVVQILERRYLIEYRRKENTQKFKLEKQEIDKLVILTPRFCPM